MTVQQVADVGEVSRLTAAAIISVSPDALLTRRVDPMPHMRACRKAIASRPASPTPMGEPAGLSTIFRR